MQQICRQKVDLIALSGSPKNCVAVSPFFDVVSLAALLRKPRAPSARPCPGSPDHGDPYRLLSALSPASSSPMDLLRALLLLVFVATVFGASCSSSQYCPVGWSVKRREDRSAMTCEATDPSRKCPKPFACVRSHCELSFCCANQKILERMRAAEEEAAEDSDDEL
uniref:WAP domain-containing protein n=1 Tax=Steinernema glaseri TaxID=37863 RepID=A0A1I7ZCF5_9BILA